MSVAVVGQGALLGALAGAREVEVSAYVLDRREPVVKALEAAAQRGARVRVRLEGKPYSDHDGAMAKQNRALAAELRGCGAVVTLAGSGSEPVHMKAALVDGVAYLDDRNFPPSGRDTVVATSDPDDVAVVRAALQGVPGSDAHLATEKAGALRLEAQAIAQGRGDRVDVESEGFGLSVISKALRQRALGGAAVRLLVAQQEFGQARTQERQAIARLVAAGGCVRVGRSNEKLCVAGDVGWVGSANATYAAPMLDWGMQTRAAPVLDALQAAFDRNWAAAVPAATS
jgi:hypothetical protein